MKGFQSKAKFLYGLYFGASLFLCLGAVNSAYGQAPSENLPFYISPEEAKDLFKKNEIYVLIDVDTVKKDSLPLPSIAERRIYYSTSFPSRNVKDRVLQDRNSRPSIDSQHLTGTPIDWHRLGLPMQQDPVPRDVLRITPSQLSEAIKENSDIQIIDLRPVSPTDDHSVSDKVFRLSPAELAINLPDISNKRWTVLIDDGSGLSKSIAENLSQQGYALLAVLDGGYPAWVAATNK